MKLEITPRKYAAVYLALLALLGLTFSASLLHLGRFALIIALTVATAKMILILLYFMHLRYRSRLTWIFAGAGFFWLGILFALAMSDYLSRGA